MKQPLCSILLLVCCLSGSAGRLHAQPTGPFPPDDWPASANPDSTVHFFSVGDAFQPLGANWITGGMIVLSGGDQVTEPIQIGGFDGLKVIGNYLNTADPDYAEWADDEEIDILMQVYGNGSLLQADGTPRNYNFLIGTLPELDFPVGGQLPVEANNRRWNWVLFRIPNTERPSDGTRRVGSVPEGAQGDTRAGGVNGGTIRMEGVPNLIVRVIAFGERGAFGEPEQVNVFAEAPECAPEPETNLAWVDIAAGTNSHMEVLNNGDQTVTFQDNVGPENNRRRAVRAEGLYMNFGVTDEFLGAPCTEPRTVKICVEFYDDPALAGLRFGPEAFATDDQGSIGMVADTRWHTLAGSGTWQHRSWTIPGVSLYGVNTAPLTGGPRLFFENGANVFISKFELGVFRTGSHPLAGQDPLPNCFDDPQFCEGVYGNYAELDLAQGVMDGLAPGTSGGDQEMIQEEGGPADDRRMAIRAALDDGSSQFAHNFLNFAITEEKLGPSSQPGVRLAIVVTYYDDPALAGAQFRPEVYISDRGGIEGFAFVPASQNVTLEGTDEWRDAYFELTDVKFNGVNQGPQAAARFVVTDKILFSRVRYGVIRPCGPDANVNPLEEFKPEDTDVEIAAALGADGSVRISWPATAEGFILESTATIGETGSWAPATETPVVENGLNVVTLNPTTGARFFRLRRQ